MSDTSLECRSCGSKRLLPVLDLGETPLADQLLDADQLEVPEYTAPLDVVFCEECTLVQITVSVPPEILFCNNYPYFSSVNPALMEHFGASARDIMEKRDLGADSLVVEAASNDGYMLRNFVERGIPVLGIDPADGPAKAAEEAGVRTMNTFFTTDLAKSIKQEHGGADIFLANNVLAHVPDLNGFVDGIKTLLKDDGMAVIECPHVVDLVDHCEFDTIYHQHLCYFSATALDNLFRRHGLYLNEVKHLGIHGGSLRLFVEPREAVGSSVRELLGRGEPAEGRSDRLFPRFRREGARRQGQPHVPARRPKEPGQADRRLWRCREGHDHDELLRHRQVTCGLCGRRQQVQAGPFHAGQPS